MKATERCDGAFKLARDVRDMSHLGSKFYGKAYGTCSVCGGHVRASKGMATAHKPQTAKAK